MRNGKYPTLDEFWARLLVRRVEPDLAEELRFRTHLEEKPVARVGDQSTVESVMAVMIPGEVPARALAAFVDENFDKQLGRGDDKAGTLPRAELIPEGFRLLERWSQSQSGLSFHELGEEQQRAALSEATQRKLKGPLGFDSKEWFQRVLELALLGFGSDPRGMVQMGYPGPSYRPGHLWLDRGKVEQRVARRRGYMYL